MDQRDSRLEGVTYVLEGDGVVVDMVFARICRVHASQNFHQGAFTCTILANQCQHLAWVQLKRDFVQGTDAWELLTQPANLQ